MLQGLPSIMGSRRGINQYYRSITLDQPASDLSNFTILFTGTYSWLKTVANGGQVKHGSGYDIRFFSDSALTTMLKFERVYWSATTGECEFWIKIPTLTSASATVIYIAYGSATVTTDQQDPANAYDSNTKAVYHYGDGTTLNANDSIGVNNGTVNGTVVAAAGGKTKGAADFDGSTGYINNGTDASLESTTFTYSAWIYIRSASSPSIREIFSNLGANQGPNLRINGNDFPTQPAIFFEKQGDSTVSNTGSALALNQWHLLAINYDGTDGAFFYNGNYVPFTNAKTMTFGGDRIVGGQDTVEFDGLMDVVKYANVRRNEAWLDAEYSNQNDPANFYSIGSEVIT